MQIKDKLIALTGGGKGIGRAMAVLFASRGAHLALLDINETELKQTAALCETHGMKIKTYQCNVAIESEVVATFEKVAADFGRLDVLINNAGILRDAMLIKRDQSGHIRKMSLQHWQQVMDVNLTGVFLCGREAAVHMIQFGNGGVIVNLSSISRAGNIGQSNYAA